MEARGSHAGGAHPIPRGVPSLARDPPAGWGHRRRDKKLHLPSVDVILALSVAHLSSFLSYIIIIFFFPTLLLAAEVLCAGGGGEIPSLSLLFFAPRSRLADFHTNCQASFQSLTGCPGDNYQACLGSYAGLIGECRGVGMGKGLSHRGPSSLFLLLCREQAST